MDEPISTADSSAPQGDARVPPRAEINRRRAAWLAATLAVVAVASAAAWLVDVVVTERRLQAITSQAPVPLVSSPVLEAPPGPVPKTAPESAMQPSPQPAPAPEAAPASPARPHADPAPPAVAAVAGAAALAAVAPAADAPPAEKTELKKPELKKPALKKAVPKKAAKRGRHEKQRMAAAPTAPKRHAGAALRDDATFARCPAPGRPGARRCRWHICNGAAAREAACRPYLEY